MIPFRFRVRTTAFHEAGHAIAALEFGIPFSKVSILKRTDFENRSGESLGQLTRISPVNKPDYFGRLEEAKAEAVLAFCGPLAECLAYGELKDPDLAGSNLGDFKDARSILRFATTPCIPTNPDPFSPADIARTQAQVDELLNECGRVAEQLVKTNESTIQRIAEALLDHWDVPADEVKQLWQATNGSPIAVIQSI